MRKTFYKNIWHFTRTHMHLCAHTPRHAYTNNEPALFLRLQNQSTLAHQVITNIPFFFRREKRVFLKLNKFTHRHMVI